MKCEHEILVPIELSSNECPGESVQIRCSHIQTMESLTFVNQNVYLSNVAYGNTTMVIMKC